MPGGPRQSIQVFPERTGRIPVQVPIHSSPGYPRNRTEPLSLLQSIHDFHQSFLPLPPDNHINPGMIMENILVIKGNMGPSPYGYRVGIEALDRLEDFGRDGEVDGKGGDPYNLRPYGFKGLLDSTHWRATELNIFQKYLVPRFFQSCAQVEQTKRHG
jgi:hypothetical protein